MAVYTTIADDELAAFMSRYDIGQVISLAGIAEGVENSNFLLRTDRNNYILTLYEKRTNAADLPFFMGLMDHLSAHGIHCPAPITDKSGQILQQVAGRPGALFSFLNGVTAHQPNVVKCRQLGGILAQMHQATADFTMKRDNALGPQGWQPLLDSIDDSQTDLPAGLKSEAHAVLQDILADWPQGLPETVIHADLFPNNVMFIGDKLTGVIDFYFACHDITAYDLAICLNSWCFEADGSFNVTKSAALLAGYDAVRPLQSDEITALPVLCRGAAMRFFLTRFYDWINTPKDAFVKPHDPMEYWSKLRFHLRATSAASYGYWS